MSTALDLYGFATFDPNVVDTRHELLCPGCRTCDYDAGGPCIYEWSDIYSAPGVKRPAAERERLRRERETALAATNASSQPWGWAARGITNPDKETQR